MFSTVVFGRITNLPDPEDRMMAVLEWYLTSFHAGRQVTRGLLYCSYHHVYSILKLKEITCIYIFFFPHKI